MRRIIPLFALFILITVTSASDDTPRTYPEAEKLKDGRYDCSARWQAMFGLDGKLEIKTGIRDERWVDADGHIESTLVALPTVAGWYTFTFIKTDELGRVLQVRTDLAEVTAEVDEDEATIRSPVIDPADKSVFQTVYVSVGREIHFRWSFYPGGEGPIGGWSLHKTDFLPVQDQVATDPIGKYPPSVPGYEGAKGE